MPVALVLFGSLYLSSYASVNVQERILFISFLLRIRQKLSQFVFVFVGKYVQFRNWNVNIAQKNKLRNKKWRRRIAYKMKQEMKKKTRNEK